jgi:hypothetical protein
MKKTAMEWAKASGAKKQTLLMKMKQMTKEKKELQAEMERAVMDIDKDATLQVDERYVKIAIRGAIGRLVEKQLKAAIPNRSARRLMERKRTQFHEFVDRSAPTLVREMKATMSVTEWQNLQIFTASIHGLTEADEMSDDQIAQTVADLAKEMTKGDLILDPKALDIQDNPKDFEDIIDPDSDAKVKMEHAFNKASKHEKRIISEGVALAVILGAPTILKMLGNIVDYIGSFITGKATPEERGKRRVIARLAVVTKADGAIPSKEELKGKLGGIGKGISAGISFKDDAEFIDAAYEEVGKEVEIDLLKAKKAAEKKPGQHAHKAPFEVDGSKSIPLEDKDLEHVLHIMHTAEKATQAGKFLGELSHWVHGIFVKGIRAVLTPAIALVLGYQQVEKKSKGFFGKAKDMVKGVWGSIKGLFGAMYKEAYNLTEKYGDAIYTTVMIIATIMMGMSTLESLDKISTPMGNIGELISKHWDVLTEAGTKISKLADLSLTAFQSILQLVLAKYGIL